MEDRLLRLEARVDELARTVERLQARLTEAGLPEAGVDERSVVAPAADSRPTLTSEVLEHLPSLAGRSCLVLGGAFLLRYATEGGMLSGLAGTMLALVYAFGWFFAADRAAGAGLRASAIFHVLTASFVVFPLVWESTARFDTLSGSAGAAILALAVAAGLVVGVRRSLDAAAKTVFVFALLSAAGLLAVSHQPTPFAVLLLVMGAVSLLLAGARGWTGVALSTALVVDVAVVLLIVLARSSNPPDWVLATPIAAIQMALAGVYFGAFGIFLVGSDLAAGPVTWLQAAAAFVIGFEAALPHLSGDRWPGFFALVVAAASWIFAHLLERAGRPLTSFLWAAFFGTAFAVEGGGWCSPTAGRRRSRR